MTTVLWMLGALLGGLIGLGLLLVAAVFTWWWISDLLYQRRERRWQHEHDLLLSVATPVAEAVSYGAFHVRHVIAMILSTHADERDLGLAIARVGRNVNFSKRVAKAISRKEMSPAVLTQLLCKQDPYCVSLGLDLLGYLSKKERRLFRRHLSGVATQLKTLLRDGPERTHRRLTEVVEILARTGELDCRDLECVLENGIWYDRMDILSYLPAFGKSGLELLGAAATNDSDWRNREKAIILLGRTGKAAFQWLSAATADSDWRNRYLAAEQLRCCGSEALPVLENLLYDSHPYVASVALNELDAIRTSLRHKLRTCIANGRRRCVQFCIESLGCQFDAGRTHSATEILKLFDRCFEARILGGFSSAAVKCGT